MANTEEAPRKTIFEKLKEIIPLVTPLLMFSAIAFTYFTYFFDVYKTPQIIIQNTITKIHETDDHYVVKLTLKLKNQSKIKVEVIANLGKLYAYKCSFPVMQNDSQFIGKIRDSTLKINAIDSGEPFELHQNIEWHEERLIGFFQPIHNASWLLPEETYTYEIVSAVSKAFDVVYYYYTIDFTDNENDIYTKYILDRTGDPEYVIYTLHGDDTISIREQNIENLDSLDLKDSPHNIYTSGSQYVAWLNSGGKPDNTSDLKIDTLSTIPGETKEEK